MPDGCHVMSSRAFMIRSVARCIGATGRKLVDGGRYRTKMRGSGAARVAQLLLRQIVEGGRLRYRPDRRKTITSGLSSSRREDISWVSDCDVTRRGNMHD